MPPVIYRDVVIVGASTQESGSVGPSGEPRGFDVRTGKRTAGSGQDLPPLTVRIEKGHVQLSIWE